MRPHILILVLSLCCFAAASKICSKRAVTTYLKNPLYQYSTKILDRVAQETKGHFVFSPISSWMQLINIAEGASKVTLAEIKSVTGRRWRPCMRKMLRVILNLETEESKIKSKSLVIVDRFLKVKKEYRKKLELSKTVRVVYLDFDNPDASTDKANVILSRATGGNIVHAVVADDFYQTSFLMNDALSFSNLWLKPFNPVYTKNEEFYNNRQPIGKVKMMSQTEHFNYTKIDKFNLEILELPCIDENHSMLIFLPTKGRINDLFLQIQNIRLATIFNLFKKHGDVPPLVNVKLPRFEIVTEVINLPELIYDMGVKRIFNPKYANLEAMSKYPISVSVMKQSAFIRVTEEGVYAGADSTISNDVTTVDFIANRPFGFMLVQRSTEIPLYAGIYLQPSLY